MINPKITRIVATEGKNKKPFGTNGWYGFFNGRIFDEIPEKVEAEFFYKDGTKGRVIVTKDKIEYGKIQDGHYLKISEEKSDKNDLNIFLLVVRDLVNGKTPLDSIEKKPVFFGSEIGSYDQISAPGIFLSLQDYYNANPKKTASQRASSVASALGQYYKNGRHTFIDAKNNKTVYIGGNGPGNLMLMPKS